MFDVIRKDEFFDWWDRGLVDRKTRNLKAIQDAWILAELEGMEGLTICEVGGGDSRVLRRLAPTHACVNADRFEGAGQGPTDLPEIPGVRFVRTFMGDFDPALADASFDVLFSISVIEHVPDEDLAPAFADMARLLKPGGRLLHAIDLYLYDDWADMPEEFARRIGLYTQACAQPGLGLRWRTEPAIAPGLTFRCDFVSNTDQQLASWNRLVPHLREERARAQVCSLKMELIKDGP